MSFQKYLPLFLSCLLLISACRENHKQEQTIPVTIARDSLARPQAKEEAATQQVLSIHFHILKLDSTIIVHLKDSFSEKQLDLISMLNRIDIEKVYKVNKLIVPDTFLLSPLSYAPFPDSLKLIASVRRILLVSYSIQAFAAYENGRLVRWGPISMGKKSTPTPTGLFFTNWKSRETKSTVDDAWVLKWYFNIVNESGVSLHQFDLPGYPASHSCIRLKAEDAEWFYYWAEQWIVAQDKIHIRAHGTPVIIFGNYGFRKKAPWLKLKDDPHANDFSADSLSNKLQQYIPEIKEKETQRDSVAIRGT